VSRQWTLGEVFVLRHAGFPFDWIEELGVSAELSNGLGALLDVEKELVALAAQAGGEKASTRVEAELFRGQLPPAPRHVDAAWSAAADRYVGLRRKLDALYAQERARLRARLREHAKDPGVQEAVFLSSPDMYENVWTRYLAAEPGPDTADSRRVERQVYSYLQRFCAKNETASFFGPMGYGEIQGDGPLEFVTLPENARRRTFFAFWALQELAKAITLEPEIWRRLPMRANPIFRIEGGRARCTSVGIDVPLPPALEPVVAAVRAGDGTMEDVAARVGLEPAALDKLLIPLLKGGIVVRELRYRTDDLEVFESLRATVDALPPSDAREKWRGHLARLEGMRARFEAAPLDERRKILPELEAAFTALTGVAARRGEGQIYTDRLLVYEEAGSKFRLRMGERQGRELAAALSPGLELSAAFGERVQRGFAQQVRERMQGESGPLDLLQYASKLAPSDADSQRYKALDPVVLPDAALAEGRVPEELCGSSSPGGRFALPDVCIGRRADGSFDILLARVHHHLLVWNWLGAFYEDRPRLEQVAKRWLQGEPSAASLVEMSFSRRNKAFYRYPGRRILYSISDPLPAGEHLHATELTVSVGAEGPILRTPDGERLWLYLPLADFSTHLPYAALAHPLVLHAPLRAPAPHLPRLRLGDATYQRARWDVALPALPKLGGLELLLALQRERRRHGWPRFVFGRVPSERKPFLLDTESPFAAELLRHLIRGEPTVSFEEMHPAPDELFLQDERGRYTFELRMQAERWTDPKP